MNDVDWPRWEHELDADAEDGDLTWVGLLILLTSAVTTVLGIAVLVLWAR